MTRFLPLALALAACTGEQGLALSNAEPEVTIVSPGDGKVYGEGDPIELVAEAFDKETPFEDLQFGWTGPDGALEGVELFATGTALFTLKDPLPVGEHVLTVQVVDGAKESAEDSVTVSVVANALPEITVVAPTGDVAFSLPAGISVSIDDPDEADLSDLDLTWGGVAAGEGPLHPDAGGLVSFNLTGLPIGTHALSLTATDSRGESGERSWTVKVVDGDIDNDSHIDEIYGGDDCDDDDSAVYLGAIEVCDGKDNDCDTLKDDNPPGQPVYFADTDNDGFGDPANATAACALPSGYVVNDDDCDDDNAQIKPGAVEICDGLDQNCDGDEDLPVPADAPAWYTDGDGDTYGKAGTAEKACAAPPGKVGNDDDCDDLKFNVKPGASEFCNDLDDDCDTVKDEDAVDAPAWYKDGDDDGIGAGTPTFACDDPGADWVPGGDDCDDNDDENFPGHDEACDGQDNDCDPLIDEDACPCPAETYDGHAYLFCDEKLTWDAARSDCNAMGYDLVAISDQDENDWINLVADDYSTAEWWIGLNDVATEGTFVWEDGTPVTFTSWHDGEPNNFLADNPSFGEDCAEINYWTDGTWNDKSCAFVRSYVCEVEP